MARGAARVGAMRFHARPQRCRRLALDLRQIGFDTGRRVGRTDVEERFEEPLAPLDRRRAGHVRRDRQQRALAEQPAPHVELRSQRHAAELRSVNVGDPVVLREPLIDEGVIGREQVQDAAVFVNDAAEEQLDLAPESFAQRAIEVRKQVHDGLAGLHAANVQPLPREVFDERVRARVGDHPLDLLLEHLGVVQTTLRGKLDQLLVRDAAPEEEREARGELQIADPVRRPRRRPGRLDLRSIDELRIREDALHHGLDAVIEAAAFFTSGLEEAHHRLDVGIGRGAAEGFARQRGNDLCARTRLPRCSLPGSTRRSCRGSACS